MQHPAAIAVAASDAALAGQSRALADKLGLPYCEADTGGYDYILRYVQREETTVLQVQTQGEAAPGPLHVDFVGGALGYRQRRVSQAREPLARAVGIKQRLRAPAVIDATGGLGRDAYVLANLGCRVILLERAPVLAALLRDGLARAAAAAHVAPVIARIEFVEAEAAAYLAALPAAARPDVVYLDPMYPERGKSALVKKEMRYLRGLVGDDLDAPALLAAALRAARLRVVVKRPRLAPALAGPAPSTTLPGSTTRFDIYLTAPAQSSAPAGHTAATR